MLREHCIEKRGTNENILYLWIIFVLPIIMIGGVSSYPRSFRYPAIVCSLVVFVFYLLFVKRRVAKNGVLISFLVVLGVLAVGTLRSLEPLVAAPILLTYCCGVMLICLDLPGDVFEKILKVMEIICLVIAATIILSVFIDNFVITYLSKLVDPRGTGAAAVKIYSEIAYSHSYSGLAMEKAEAAYIMNVGIAVVLARWYSGRKMSVWSYIELIVFALGLILANKRTLFVTPFLCYIVITFLMNKKGKITKFFLIAAGFLSIFIFLSEYIPQVNNIILRFSSGSNGDVLNGRSDLWKYSLKMFTEKPIFGYGFASFNEYSFRHGYLYKDAKMNFFGHNCYLETLGELGILGSLIFWYSFLTTLFLSMKMLRKYEIDKDGKYLLIFSVYVQVMFLFYSLTGNVVYYQDQIMLWMFSISIVLYVRRYKCVLNVQKPEGKCA